MLNGIGIIAGESISNVDHLVPLCQLMDIPLLCTNQSIADLIEIFYPEMKILVSDPYDFCLNETLGSYDSLFYVDLYRNGNGSFQFMEYLYEGKARSVCGLHGNSDKKRNLFWAERYADEDVILLYGPHMVDFLKEKNIWGRFNHCIITGNFRYQYYLKHQNFFDNLINQLICSKNNKKTILYAPTWCSSNRKSDWRVDYSSFFLCYKTIFDQLPDEFEMIVKIHPYLKTLFLGEIEEIKEEYSHKENLIFLDHFPVMYPLLSKVDYYLGDYSSVGYDFLTFDRPLYFLNDQNRDAATDKGVYLYQCGTPIPPDSFKDLYHFFEKGDTSLLREKRQEIYSYAFGDEKTLEVLKKEIQESLS